MPMQVANWKNCPGVTNDGIYAHSMRPHCSSCAPFWEKVPTCPTCGRKLQKYGRTKCQNCGVWCFVPDPPEE